MNQDKDKIIKQGLYQYFFKLKLYSNKELGYRDCVFTSDIIQNNKMYLSFKSLTPRDTTTPTSYGKPSLATQTFWYELNDRYLHQLDKQDKIFNVSLDRLYLKDIISSLLPFDRAVIDFYSSVSKDKIRPSSLNKDYKPFNSKLMECSDQMKLYFKKNAIEKLYEKLLLDNKFD